MSIPVETSSSAPARRRRIWLWVLLAALVQSAILASMLFDRNWLMATGREIVLPIIPVDPRSLFQGDYVRLGYEISQIGASDIQVSGNRQPIYVIVQKSADGVWKRVATSTSWPANVGADQVVLAGRARWSMAEFGIETFFVPEGTGKSLEELVRDKKLSAAIVVDSRGRAALVGLLVDGQPAYREPWY